MGGVGIDLRVSCVLCWYLLKVRMGFWRPSLSLCQRTQTKQSKIAWVDTSAGGCRSFAEVLQSKPCFELKGWSSICMDLLQVMTRSEMGNTF
jgi:hypothetical protein